MSGTCVMSVSHAAAVRDRGRRDRAGRGHRHRVLHRILVGTRRVGDRRRVDRGADRHRVRQAERGRDVPAQQGVVHHDVGQRLVAVVHQRELEDHGLAERHRRRAGLRDVDRGRADEPGDLHRDGLLSDGDRVVPDDAVALWISFRMFPVGLPAPQARITTIADDRGLAGGEVRDRDGPVQLVVARRLGELVVQGHDVVRHVADVAVVGRVDRDGLRCCRSRDRADRSSRCRTSGRAGPCRSVGALFDGDLREERHEVAAREVAALERLDDAVVLVDRPVVVPERRVASRGRSSGRR